MAFFQMILILGGVVGISVLGILGFKSVKIVRPHERGLVERFGEYKRTASPGITFILPFIDALQKIDLRERVIDVPPQDVITEDDAVVTVDALVYFEVRDPLRVAYKVENFELAATKLAQTSLRDIIGGMELDETLTSRNKINSRLEEILDEATDRWGVNITRVELQKIEPPEDLVEAMAQQMKAERNRRATIREAKGIKQAEILKAEGEADAIQKVYSAIHRETPSKELIAIKYLEALQKMADGKATKIFLPVESSGVLGSIGSIRELLKGEEEGLEETAEKIKTKERGKEKIND